MMALTIVWLVASLVAAAASFEDCPENFCPPLREKMKMIELDNTGSIDFGSDKVSGCTCKKVPQSHTFCFGAPICRSFPKNMNITTRTFRLRSSQIFEIKPGDLANFTHLETLIIDRNYNLIRILAGSFINMSKLKDLSISSNSNLKILENGSLDGLIGLQRLFLVKNAFVKLSDLTPALKNLRKLTQLELSENKFSKVEEQDFASLDNSNLEELNLILCQIEDIDPKAFNVLTKLSILRLGQNSFNATTITGVIEETIDHVPLRVLNLCSIGLRKNNSKQLLAAIARSNITSLSLERNQLEMITSETFGRMPNIEFLDLTEVSALNIANNTFVGLPNLRTLLLSENKLASIPEDVFLEQLTYLDLKQKSGAFAIHEKNFINMKNLELLDLSYNALSAIRDSSFLGLEKLRVLELKNATIYHIWKGAFAMLSQLEFLNLENNPFVKNYPSALEQRLFEGLGNLRMLLLGGCGIHSIGKAKSFKDLKKLEHLKLDNNGLMILPNFEVLIHLKTIDVSHNGLQQWNEPVFYKNQYLVDVKVNDNKLIYLTNAMLQDFNNLTNLDLENNPFTCDCSFAWNKKVIELIENQTIFCAFPVTTTNLTLKQFFKTNFQCELILIIIPLVLLVLFGATIFSVYHFRWHLRYWLFLTRLHLSRNRKIKPTAEPKCYTNYIYDAFVSYSNEDENFVIRLVTMLENYPPFIKLCVYERDFEVGTMISENVLESVAKSRKTLLVISNSYTKSQWCRWESQIAEHHRLFFQNENGEYVDDSLILIKLGPVNEAYMTPTLKYLLKTRIYLQWDLDEKKQKVFWEKLRSALAPPKEINENTYL